MLRWTEYAIVRKGVQLRDQPRPLTEADQYLLDFIEAETKRYEIRESQPPPEKKPAPRKSRWNTRATKWFSPLANSRYRD